MKLRFNWFITVLLATALVAGCKKSDNPDPDGGGNGTTTSTASVNGTEVEFEQAIYSPMGLQGGTYLHNLSFYTEALFSSKSSNVGFDVVVSLSLITPEETLGTGEFPSMDYNVSKNNLKALLKTAQLNENISQFSIGGSIVFGDDTDFEKFNLPEEDFYVLTNSLVKIQSIGSNQIKLTQSSDISTFMGTKIGSLSLSYSGAYITHELEFGK